MRSRTSWFAPLALFVVAMAVVTLSLADARRENAANAAGMPYHSIMPLLAADDGSAPALVTATPGTATPSPTPSATPTVAANACGSGHASLATFSDAAAANISRTAQAETMAQLRTQVRPAVPADAVRTGPVETTVYSVDVALVSMTMSPNKTVSLIVADPAHPESTIRVELPDQPCYTAAAAGDRGLMLSARSSMRIACGDPLAGGGTKQLAGTATLTGAGFWGSQALDSAAPNGIELAPLLGFEFTGSTCDPNHVTPTVVPTQPPLVSITVAVFTVGPGGEIIPVVPVPGIAPGKMISGIVQTQPAVSGLECTVQYVNPPVGGATVGLVDFDPALGPKITNADGSAIWSWMIPADSGPGEGKFEGHCGGKIATAKVVIS